jgi:hypothetical protein
MSSASSQIFWKSSDPEGTLRVALTAANTRLEELALQQWEPTTATIGGIRDYKLCCLAADPVAWSSLLLHLNSRLAHPLAARMSAELVDPVTVFDEFDQVAWGFSVYEAGNCIARFWNCPAIVEEDPQTCAVNPDLIARLFDVPVERVAPYLTHVNPDVDGHGKVFADDEFSLGDHWVRCDFMRRLGLHYPNPGEPGTRHVFIKERRVN